MIKRKMATALGQTLKITQQDNHFKIDVLFIGVTGRTMEFNVGDEFEMEVGPGVNVKVGPMRLNV